MTNHLYNSHRQACLFGELFPYVSRRFRRRRERGLQYLQLLGLDSCSRTSSLRARPAVPAAAARSAVGALVLRLTVPRLGVAVERAFVIKSAIKETIYFTSHLAKS